ncbi:Cold shock-like protein CspD [compost metagenome]
MDGYKTLKAGQPVTFNIIQGPKGLHAVDIAAAEASAGQALPATQQETVSG